MYDVLRRTFCVQSTYNATYYDVQYDAYMVLATPRTMYVQDTNNVLYVEQCEADNCPSIIMQYSLNDITLYACIVWRTLYCVRRTIELIHTDTQFIQFI